MPATVLEILQEDGIYPNFYFGKNMTDTVAKELFRQDWWYRTTFTVPAGHKLQWLVFKGINYRAEIWLNGERLANSRQIAGMYNEFELNVTGKAKVGAENVLAVRVTPEQAFRRCRWGGIGRCMVRLDQFEISGDEISRISRLAFLMCRTETRESGSRSI